MINIPYEYKNCPIPGGGYVTGFLFGRNDEKAQYIRTDIGGTYRYERSKGRFTALNDAVDMTDLAPTYAAALAVNEKIPGSLYIACGVDRVKEGELLISKDYGKSFIKKQIPVNAHGNKNGRGTGKRLFVDEEGTIYFASYEGGLLVSENEGDSWKKLDVCGEEHMTFAFKRPGTDTIVVGTAGISKKKSDKERGHSLYISYDNGVTFEEMPEPETGVIEKSRMTGLVGHRLSFDGEYLYITANHTGEYAYIVEPGYSADCGQVFGGMVLKYGFDANGKILNPVNIAPCKDFKTMRYGYGNLSIAGGKKGLMVLSTITRGEGDIVYRSYDGGDTWENVLEGLRIGDIKFNTPYMKPECNGNDSLIHWLTDIEFNPFDDNEVWFNTGTGVFKCENFLSKIPAFHDESTGIEETVHLNVYAPVKGDTKLLDILGDLGGFAFKDLDKPCKNSFDDENGNRYITCINADYSDEKGNVFIVTPRGNWTGKTKGGLIKSMDNGDTWQRIPLPFGLSEDLDRHFKDIEQPNVNSGWVAMSKDCETIVWSVADCTDLPIDLVITSGDGGKTFKKVKINTKGALDKNFKVYADRVNEKIFFGFTENGNIYISKDKGESFERIEGLSLEGVNFGVIDCANKTEIRFESGKEGTAYIAAGDKGLWKLENNALRKLSADGDSVYRVGLGINKDSKNYIEDSKAVYMCAKINSEYGFFRSFNDLKTIERINSDSQMYGDINSLDADKRVFGRFFIASGSRGVLYGMEK